MDKLQRAGPDFLLRLVAQYGLREAARVLRALADEEGLAPGGHHGPATGDPAGKSPGGFFGFFSDT